MTCNGNLHTSDCERVRPTGIAQPMNAATSLAYLPAGLGVLIAAWQTDGPKRLILSAYAVALTMTGVGSVTYHGNRPGETHHVHNGSLRVTLALAVSLLTHVALNGEARWRNPHVRRLLILGALAAGAYEGGRTGSPLCRPNSPLQLHAAWHVLSALAAVVTAQAAAESRTQTVSGWHARQRAHRS